MKLIKKSFFNLLKLHIVILVVFLNQFIIASNSIPGRKIKKQKAYEKKLIKKNILRTVSHFLDTPTNKYISLEKNTNIDNLSQSAQERYKLENNFIQGSSEGDSKNLIDINKKNMTYLLPFLQSNRFIKNYLAQSSVFEDSLDYYFVLLLLNKYILEGNTIQESLMQAIFKVKKYSIYFEGIIPLLENLKINNNLSDDIVIKVLNRILLYNGSDKIEIDRAINRFYNIANREPVILIIEQCNKNDFTINENNNTYGELGPSKDIYQKLIYDKTKLGEEKMRDYFQLSRRNIANNRAIKIKYYFVVPKIKSNIVEYMTINQKTKKEEKIETIINNLDSNYFYSLSLLSEKELQYLF
jgi:hypothetical protein